MENIEKRNAARSHTIVINLVRFLLIVAFLGAYFNGRSLVLFISTLAFIVTFIPYILEKKWGIKIPAEFEIIVLLFIYGSLFFGEVRGFYARYWWWDALLNLVSSTILGLIGLTVLYVLYQDEKINTKPTIIAIFAFCFAMAFAAIWEIFEFSADYFFNFNLQKNSLIDTMGDLIVNAIGAFLVSFAGYFFIKRGAKNLVSTFITNFIEKNPILFRNKTQESEGEKIIKLIKKGESERLEFKSTLRTNLHTNEIDKKVEYANLKTIVAYLNSKGGTLLVGISDTGQIAGIEKDNFPSNDKLKLHLMNLLKEKVGSEFIQFISFEIFSIEEKEILKIDCKESDRPVFLKIEKEEEFYVRNGPASVRLGGSELINYVKYKFKDN